MIAAGKWDFNKMEAAYNKIEQIRVEIKSSGKELTEEQSKELSKLLAIYSPIKPFLFTHERINLGNGKIFLNPVNENKNFPLILIHKFIEICG